MNQKQAEKIAKEVVEYLFNDGTKKRVERLMLVYRGQDFPNPGWGRESILAAIVEYILKAAGEKGS